MLIKTRHVVDPKWTKLTSAKDIGNRMVLPHAIGLPGVFVPTHVITWNQESRKYMNMLLRANMCTNVYVYTCKDNSVYVNKYYIYI